MSQKEESAEKHAHRPPMQRRRGPLGGSAGGVPGDKAKDFSGTLKRLVLFLKPQWWRFGVVAVFAVISTVFSILGPKILGLATTSLANGVVSGVFDFIYIGKILMLLLGLYVISAICTYVMHFIMASVAQKTVYRMRGDVKAKLDRLPLKYFDGRSHGEILSRVTNDMDTIAQSLQQSMTQIITSIVTLFGILAMMIYISIPLTLIALVSLPICAAITIIITKKSQGYFVNQQRTLGELNGHVEEMYTGHQIVKAFGTEERAIETFMSINERLYQVGWKAQLMSGVIMPAINLINNLGYVLICIIGGIFVIRGTIPIGDIQAFIQYMRQFTQPITQTANIANVIQSTVASSERVFEILDEAEEIPDPEEPVFADREHVRGEVLFDHVSFRYKDDVPLIENMNIHVEPGQTVAIVGPTGAGKTTLVNLLMRFYELSGGKILIDGIDITHMKRNDVRGLFGMVLQDTWLYKASIRDNIAYGREDATEEDVVRAAKAAHVDHFIRTLPEGYNTILNEEATNVSQGQKQLLTIARTILADAPIMILDEATSNVDTRTETLIQSAMSTLMEGRTNFVIAHRLSTIKKADLILVMKEGTVIEQGTHDQLMEQDGFYAELYNSQFSEEEE